MNRISMNQAAEAVKLDVTPLLRQQGKALIVPSGVVEELKSLLERKPELRETVRPVAVVLPED